ncbi:MAG: hypothetical protein A3F14_06190 [Gammaproteobacteria bacterium RIFCSPHIGHO2_12_FULL_43_28]|nr:MAG: hypothetical protein A3F14_06190 [Gammaproteobacteria bacterium RIFCSPHIGHO2_12_FULL_43_28]
MRMKHGTIVILAVLGSPIASANFDAHYAQNQPEAATPLAYPTEPAQPVPLAVPPAQAVAPPAQAVTPPTESEATSSASPATIVDEHGNLKMAAPPAETLAPTPPVDVPQPGGPLPADSTQLPEAKAAQSNQSAQPGETETQTSTP